MLTLSDIDSDSRARISSIIHETVLAAPGTYEVPTLCKIVESKSIYNANAIHWVLDDELDFGGLDLDKYNRLYSKRHTMPSPRPPVDSFFVGPQWSTDRPPES